MRKEKYLEEKETQSDEYLAKRRKSEGLIQKLRDGPGNLVLIEKIEKEVDNLKRKYEYVQERISQKRNNNSVINRTETDRLVNALTFGSVGAFIKREKLKGFFEHSKSTSFDPIGMFQLLLFTF
eukprot:Pgem_evm1s13060